MADGTKFEIDVDARADSVEPAANAVELLARQLQAAGEASSAAAAAVVAGQAAYDQAEAAANRAAKALESIGIQADAQAGKVQAALEVGDVAGAEKATAKLNALNQRQQELAAKAAAANEAVKAEAVTLDGLKAAASKAADAQKGVAKGLDAQKKAAEAASKAAAAAAGSGKVNELAEAFGKLGGPLGSVGAKAFGTADGIGKLLGAAGSATGIYVGLAVAVVAVSAALIGGVAAILKWAVSLSDANRSARLLSDGIAGTVAGGRELDAAIASLEQRVPQTSDELRSMAADLAKTGLKGQALTDALEESATKAAELKWGPDFAKGANTLDKVAKRLSGNVGKLFDLNIEPLLDSLAQLVGLFDETSVTGKAIKVVFGSIFQPLLDGLVGLTPKIVSTFIQFEIWGLKSLIAVRPLVPYFLFAGKVIGGAALAIGAAFAVLIGITLTMAALSATLVGSLVWLGSKMFEIGAQVVDFLSGLSLDTIGKAMIDGLVSGLMSGGAAVLSAITGVVGGAVDAAKNLLGIASPSKVFAEIGANTGAGMVEGVEGSTKNVQGSLESMVSPPMTSGAPSSSSSGSSGSINLAGASFNFYGVEGAEDAQSRFGEILTRLLEGDAAQLGTEAPA